MIGVLRGMLTTLGHVLKKPVTIQYPEEQMEMPPWTRGRPRLIYELDSGDLRCTACNACAIACPVDVIKIDQHAGPDRKKVLDRFDIDMGGCIECALCVEACPFRAITMAPDFEMAYYDRAESLVFNMYQLRMAGTPEVDSGMEHIQGVKRGLVRTSEPARPTAGAAPATAPAVTPAAATAAPVGTAAQVQVDPKDLEGLTPAERAALYKQRQREAGFVPPGRSDQPAAAPLSAPAPAAAPPNAAVPAAASSSGSAGGENWWELSPEDAAKSPDERAAIYKARQRAAGIGQPPKRED